MAHNIYGTINADTLDGTDENDNIYGYGGNDTLAGHGADDFLYGGKGADLLIGGSGFNDYFGGRGNDTYAMSERTGDSLSDDLIHDFVHGDDTIDVSAWGISDFEQVQALLYRDHHGRATINAYYDNTDHVLRLAGVATGDLTASDFAFSNAGAKTETGTGNDDTLFGSGADDTLNGGGGFDALLGGGGDDVLSGGSGLDWFDGGAGNDTVEYSYSNELLDINLVRQRAVFGDGAKEFMRSIESVTGSDGANRITGDGGNNTLEGRGGDDTLAGKLGHDVLIGDAGADWFVFDTALSNSNVDTINDFTPGTDQIRLAGDIFAALPDGLVAASHFEVNDTGVATANSTRIIYDNANGALYYDHDGLGGDAAQQFAQLDAGLGSTISHSDFFVT